MTENKDVSLEGLEFDGETVLCRVCGDKASGFHYGVHACEGCKGFFRRSIQQKIQYRPCLKNQQCNIMRVNRNRCQYCRLKKCIAVGMSRDAVRFGRVPKKEKAKIMEVMQKAFTQSQNSALNILLENETRFHELIIDAHMNTSGYTHAKIDQFCQEAWEQAQYVNCPAHKACPLNPIPESQSDKKWDDFSEFFTPAIRNVVDFAKSIPGFDLLCQEDQVTLLKAGTFEVLLVQLAPLFNSSMDTMAFTNGKLFKRTGSANGSNAGFLLDSMFDFSERLNLLKLSDSETALFSALVIIASDRPGLRNPDQVDKIQDKIRQGLQAQMMANHPEDSAAFAKLLLKIPDLRTLNTLHSEKLLGLSVQPGASTSQEVNGYTQQPPTTANGIMSGMHGIGVCPIQRTPAVSQQPVIPVPAHPTPMDTNNNSHIVLQTSWGTFTRHNPSFTAMAPQPASESSTANSIKRQANPLVAHLLTTDVDMMPDDRNSANLSSLSKSDAITSAAPISAQNGTAATVSNAIATNMNHTGSSAAMATPNSKATNDMQDQLERISPASNQSGSGLPKMLVTGPPGVAVDTWLQQQDGSTPVRVVAANPVPEPEGPVMQWRRRSHSGYETPSEASRSNSPVNIIDVDVNPYGSLPPSNRSSPHLYDPWGEPGSLPGEPVRKRAYSAAAEILRRGHPKHSNNGQSQPNSQRTSPSREFVVPGSDMPEAYPEPPRKRAYSYGAVSKVNRLWQKKKENFLNVCSAFSSTESISASFSQKLSVANEKEEILINGAKGQSSEGQSAMPDGQGHRPGAMMPTLKNALSKPPLDSNSLMLGQRMMGIINESLEKNTMPNSGSSDSESMSPGVETVKDDPPSKGIPENALNSLQQMVHGKQMDTDPPAKMSPAQSNSMSVDMETRPRSNTIGQGHPFIPASQQMAPNMAEQGRRNSLPVHIPRDGTFERFAVPTARVPPQEQSHVNISDSNNSRIINDCTSSGTSNSDTLIRTGSGGMAAPLLKEKILQRVASREALNQLGKTAPDGEIPSKEKSNEHAVNEMMNSALKASLQQQNGLGSLRYPLSSPFYSPLVQQQMMYPYGHFAAQHVVQMQHMQMAALQMQAQLQQQQQQQQQQQGLILADRPEGGSPLNLKKEKS